MGIGIYDLNECSSLNYKERLDIYKEYGFTSLGLYLDEQYMANGENYLEIIKYAKEIGLKVNQVHLDYKISNLIVENPNKYFNYVEKKIYEASQLNIPYLVLHASKGNNAPVIDESIIKRLEKLMDNSDVCLCFENVRDNTNLNLIMNFNIKNVKMCYDVGHAYCYDNVNELFIRFKDKIVCSHLHNNFGSDTHKKLLEGLIDIKEVINKLNKENIDNCLEVFPLRGKLLNNSEFREFISDCIKDYKSCLRN